MISTVLPRANQNYNCSPQLFDSRDPASYQISTGQYASIILSRVFHMLTGFGLSINGKHSYCGDYIYSGHTVTLTITYLFIREYLMPVRCRTLLWRIFNVLLFSMSCIAILSILISRGHYLIDILIAYYVTTRIFWIYHTLAYTPSLRSSSPNNHLSRVWWWYLFKYFECIPDDHRGASCEPKSNCCDPSFTQIPRSFEWPLPWPRWLRRRSNRYRQRLLPTPAA